MPTEDLQPGGEKIRQAVRWVAEMVNSHPEKSRQDILREAEVRFDLSPKECAFLDRKLMELP
jgi:hypothetical protein